MMAGKYPFKQAKKIVKPYRLFAWDLETTRIKPGETPRLKYVTAYGIDRYDREWKISQSIKYFEDLGEIIVKQFLTIDRIGCKYVAWNSNNFDAYFLGISLLTYLPPINPYIIIPYFVKNKQIRGLRVRHIEDKRISWEFLDGIAMTGIDSKLGPFVKSFAPEYAKLDIGLDSGTEFDPNIKEHVEYAEMDSISLYHAMMRCNNLIHNLTDGLWLTSTIGNLGIKFFQKMLPYYRNDKMERLQIWRPHQCLMDVMPRLYRGGFVHTAKKYWRGLVWKYDLNQAYAAAMRQADLPAGDLTIVRRYKPGYAGMYLVTAIAPKNNIVPFYYKDEHLRGQKSVDGFERQWICGIEVAQLLSEKWEIEIHQGWFWPTKFNMKVMVDRLEKLRKSDPEGPSGPLGTLCKSLGNNSYGKTAENLWDTDFVFSNFMPEGYEQYIEDFLAPEESCPYIFRKDKESRIKNYHQPQIAATITAHVRMQVRRAALLGGNDWIFSDTDSCVFGCDMGNQLFMSKTEYGAWKLECAGVEYTVIEDKTYYSRDDNVIHAKGLKIKDLDYDLLDDWFDTGEKPEQLQVQRNNFFKFMQGIEPMFRKHEVNQKEKAKKKRKKGENVIQMR